MPSFAHEAPLELFRVCPALAVQLARELLGLKLPPAASVRISDTALSEIVPAELRADLVIEVGGDEPVLGVILEVQRAIDPRKPFVWPAYTSVLHARLRCQTCLVVIAGDAQVAAWAGRSINTLQPGAPFRPLVLGPDQVPRVQEAAEAARAPELAVLSALIHGHGPGGAEIATVALDAAASLDDDRATLFHDLILGSLPKVMAHVLEQKMLSRNYEYRSEFARRYFAEGRAKGREEGEARGREEGEARGREEGEARGREEGRLEGQARMLVEVLRGRAVAMSDAQAAHILGCRDEMLLARWRGRMLTATTIDELLAD